MFININNLGFNKSFTLNDKIGIIGSNGCGKTTFLKLIYEFIKEDIGYCPQNLNNYKTIADVFGLEKDVLAIENYNYEDVENWNCIDIITKKLKNFNLDFDLLRDFNTLSGGEKVKVILSSIIDKKILLLDEPTNNMDYDTKLFFYDFIKNCNKKIILISHDRELLNLVDRIFYIRNDKKIIEYGGNYDFANEIMLSENEATERDYNNALKSLDKQKREITKNIIKHNKNINKGQREFKSGSKTKMEIDFKKNDSRKSIGKLVNKENKNLDKINKNINDIRENIEDKKQIYFKMNYDKIKTKNILKIDNLNFSYDNKIIFKDFNIELKSNDRLAINGKNGSGKSTLLKIIMNNEKYDNVVVNTTKIAYIDQNYNILNFNDTILNNVLKYNSNEKICRDVLAQFLFRTESVYKNVNVLSGGEVVRVALCCALINEPELLILDEITNNLDIDSIKILENILNDYKNCLIVVSHDSVFKENINVNKKLVL